METLHTVLGAFLCFIHFKQFWLPAIENLVVCCCSEESATNMCSDTVPEEDAVTVYRLIWYGVQQAVHQWMCQATGSSCLLEDCVTESWLFPHPTEECGSPAHSGCSDSVDWGCTAEEWSLL